MVVVSRKLGEDAEILVYRSGYAVYRLGKYVTVFSIHSCGDYLYQLSGKIFCISGSFFDFQEWYVRLVLEGEDRISHNRELYENEKNISYHAISEDCGFMAGLEKSPLDQLIRKETIGDFISLLTVREKQVINQFYFDRKTQKEIAKGLGVTQSTISLEISNAIRKMQKHHACGLVDTRSESTRVRKGGICHAG